LYEGLQIFYFLYRNLARTVIDTCDVAACIPGREVKEFIMLNAGRGAFRDVAGTEFSIHRRILLRESG
jgi:hypothetical protein